MKKSKQQQKHSNVTVTPIKFYKTQTSKYVIMVNSETLFSYWSSKKAPDLPMEANWPVGFLENGTPWVCGGQDPDVQTRKDCFSFDLDSNVIKYSCCLKSQYDTFIYFACYSKTWMAEVQMTSPRKWSAALEIGQETVWIAGGQGPTTGANLDSTELLINGTSFEYGPFLPKVNI